MFSCNVPTYFAPCYINLFFCMYGMFNTSVVWLYVEWWTFSCTKWQIKKKKTICGAVCFQFTHFLCIDLENIYILCLTIIIKSEVWAITHCLGLDHEIFYALYVFLYSYGVLCMVAALKTWCKVHFCEKVFKFLFPNQIWSRNKIYAVFHAP